QDFFYKKIIIKFFLILNLIIFIKQQIKLQFKQSQFFKINLILSYFHLDYFWHQHHWHNITNYYHQGHLYLRKQNKFFLHRQLLVLDFLKVNLLFFWHPQLLRLVIVLQPILFIFHQEKIQQNQQNQIHYQQHHQSLFQPFMNQKILLKSNYQLYILQKLFHFFQCLH
ncbi:hypothetical protein IMG5_059370, partial [Ichthyophthirius multifiliis]